MNNIDKEIEDFKTNLNLIEKVTKELVDNNDNFSKIIKDCQNLENIKNQLNDEISNLNKTSNDCITTITNLCEKISAKNENVLMQMTSQSQEIKSLKNQITQVSTNNDKILKITIVLLGMVIVMCLISIFK